MALLACSMLLNIPQAYAGTYSVTFTTGDLHVDTVFIVRLDLGATVETSVPTLYSGGSGSMSIDVSPDMASISLTFQGNTYTKDFPTPIGSVKIPIYDILGVGTLYVKITGNMKTTVEVEGGSVSPASLSWSSESSKSVSISHKGSMFSFDTVKITMPLSYILSLAVGVEALGTTLYEYSEDVGALSGTPIITENISPFPVALIAIIAIVVVIAIAGIAITRRSKKPG